VLRRTHWHTGFMSHPLVLIVGREVTAGNGIRTHGYATGALYADAITRAGGIPVVLPPITDLVSRLPDLIGRVDAVVLHGGGDIEPERYGQSREAESLYGMNPSHDEVELALVRDAVSHDVPMLAICRGLQIVNVALGGTLHQDLGTAAHTKRFHPVNLVEGSRTASAMGSILASACHSYHHQAIDMVGDGLVVTGRADDGTIEGVERTASRWLVAVQWHPEDSAGDDPQQQALFDELVRRARGTGA